MSQEQRKLDIVDGLREMADWLEATPEALVEGYRTVTLTYWADEKNPIVELAKTGGFDKLYGGGYMDLVKSFGPGVKYTMTIPREEVCERKVVGTRTVEVRDPELVAQVPMIERDEDIVEWECMPLLAPTDEG